MNSGDCVDHFPIRMFQIGSEETEPELSSEYQAECKIDSHCQGLKLCCTNGTFLKCVPFQNEVGFDYYLGWARLKVNVSEMDTNHSSWDHLALLRDTSGWLTAALLTHNTSDANVHVLCPEPTPGDQQDPALGFMLAVNQNYSLEWLCQGFRNLTATSEYLWDVKLGDSILQTENTLTVQGQTVDVCNAMQATQSANASIVTTVTIQPTMMLENVTAENSTTPDGKSNGTDSTDSMWIKSSTTDTPNVTWPVNQAGQRSPTTTILPTQTTVRSEMVTDTTAAITMETALTAFRASVLVTNRNFTQELNSKTSLAYGRLEELFISQLSQLLTEAADVTFNRTPDLTMLVEGFRKGSVIVDFILLTHSGENVTLAAIKSLLISAVNQSLISDSGLHMSYGNIEDFDPCENNTCASFCKALSEMYQCTCLNGRNGSWFAYPGNRTTPCSGALAVITNPLVWELEKLIQIVDFENDTGCSFSRNTPDTFGILQVKDLCQNISEAITDLWLEWKNEVLRLYLEGPNIAVCRFSVTPEQEMTYKIIYSTDGVKGSFLVDYAHLNDDQSASFAKNETLNVTMIQQRRSFTFPENESLNVTVSIQSRLARNPQLFIKSCRAMSSSRVPEGDQLIKDGCPESKGVSIFHNGDSSLVLLSVEASFAKNVTYLKCELQICAENQCACTHHLDKIYMEELKENYIEIGPITVLRTKPKDKAEPSMLMVILLSVGAILLVILLIGFLRYMYRHVAGSSFSIKTRNIFSRRSPVNPVTLKSWKQV
ncbi:uncharacterized protein LOC119968654 [Scyliorhinus canicula]|uniref:uncharacterized protein LOC119968654 n=1 Tax=Scyliorhinus canicula TaxID=7830 RepID=UPI0018F5B1B9|nr:uncharacterized protein LOC119968654 [Scyliorhinus canicula]